MITFCYDDSRKPNLAQGINIDYDHTWPFTVPLRLSMYMLQHDVPQAATNSNYATFGSWYPIGIGWFDHDCDYIGLLSPHTLELAQQGFIRLLFYYHEGDDPVKIINRLNHMCQQYKILSLPILVSANTSAEHHPQCLFFPDHEYFFRYTNRFQLAESANSNPRKYLFTALSRTHKWWRATVMSELKHSGMLDNSLWSYNTQITIDDKNADNPIRPWHPDTYRQLLDFLSNGPYHCDGSDAAHHNQHQFINASLFTDAYCNIVLETHYDADQSGGSFLTEKTFKPIKYGQPFVIVGPPGSLRALRELGYRTFDHAIDNSYDEIIDHRPRWAAIQHTIKKIFNSNHHEWFEQCLPDVLHNQKLFTSRTQAPLNTLLRRLEEKCKELTATQVGNH